MTVATRQRENPCPTKTHENRLDSDRPSHRRRFSFIAPLASSVRVNRQTNPAPTLLYEILAWKCGLVRLAKGAEPSPLPHFNHTPIQTQPLSPLETRDGLENYRTGVCRFPHTRKPRSKAFIHRAFPSSSTSASEFRPNF